MKRKTLTIFCVCVVILFLLCVIIKFLAFPKKYKNTVLENAQNYDLEQSLVYAIIKAESNFDKRAVSKSGALGLMQILPSTAKWIAKELNEEYSKENMFDEKTNIRYGCFYLNYLFKKFGDMDIVICAYNAGETKVFDWLDNGKLDREKINYAETRTYLKRVESFYRVYKNKIINL